MSIWALAALSLSMLLSSLGTSVANVALPTLAHAFTASFQGVQWVVLAYLLGVTLPIVGVGRLGDVLGRRRLLLAGLVVFTAASVLCAMASSLWMLTAARALQGLGAAILMALTVAMVGDAVPAARTGTTMGLLGTMSAVGTALGPSLGGVLLSGFGWRAIFFVNLPLGALTFLLAHRHLPADARAPGARRASPVLRLSLLRDPVLTASLAMSVLVSTVMMATLVVGPFYLSSGLGLEVALVGLALSAGPVVSALTGVPAGLFVDRFGAPRIMRVGLGAMVAGASVLALTPALAGVAAYVAPIVVLTAGYALFQAANNTAIMKHAGPEQRGVISGMLGMSRNLGLITGASVMGTLFSFASAASDVTSARPEAVATAMRVTFAAATLLSAGALGLAFTTASREP